LWTGPWRILSFKSQVVVVIQHEKSHKRQTVHIHRLAPCLTPDSHAAATLNATACPTHDDTVQTDQPNGQQPKRSPPRTSTDTSDPLASDQQILISMCRLLRFMVALVDSADDQRRWNRTAAIGSSR